MVHMLGRAAWDGLFCTCCNDRRTNHHQRQREKREWQSWAAEYESDDSPQCPLDGIRCTCNRDPIECDPWRTRATGLPAHEGVYRIG